MFETTEMSRPTNSSDEPRMCLRAASSASASDTGRQPRPEDAPRGGRDLRWRLGGVDDGRLGAIRGLREVSLPGAFGLDRRVFRSTGVEHFARGVENQDDVGTERDAMVDRASEAALRRGRGPYVVDVPVEYDDPPAASFEPRCCECPHHPPQATDAARAEHPARS